MTNKLYNYTRSFVLDDSRSIIMQLIGVQHNLRNFINIHEFRRL